MFCELEDTLGIKFCKNGGTCVDNDVFFTCLCAQNFVGVRCDYSGLEKICKKFSKFVKIFKNFNSLILKLKKFVVTCPKMQQINADLATPDAPVLIQSPAFFHDYPPNSNCSWIFQNQDPNKIIHVNLTKLAVETFQGCKDSFTIQAPTGEIGPKY